jgi:hypothetical protein
LPDQLWEWTVDQRTGDGPMGVCGERHRAMEALSRSLMEAGGSASGRVVPVALIDGAFECFYERFAALEIRADYERGVIKWT